MNQSVKQNINRRGGGAVLLPCVAALFVASAAMAAPKITISPSYTTVGVNGAVPYSATVTGLTNAAVTWKVNSVTGGNSTIRHHHDGWPVYRPRHDSKRWDYRYRAGLRQ